ncbi:hypothetical protein, partial [Aquipuribacter nitratireducens]
MLSARSGAPALALSLVLAAGLAGLAGPAAATVHDVRPGSGDVASYPDDGFVVRSLPNDGPTAAFAAAAATVSISSCFVYDQFGFVEIFGTVTAEADSTTVFEVTVTGGRFNNQYQFSAEAGETRAFTSLDFAGDLEVTVSSDGVVLARTSRNVPDCTRFSSAGYGADEIVRWSGYGHGDIVRTLTDGNTRIFDWLREEPDHAIPTAVLVPVQLDGVPGEELMSYDPVTGRQT